MMRSIVVLVASAGAGAASPVHSAHLAHLRSSGVAGGDKAEGESFTWHGLQLGKHIPEYNEKAEKVFSTPEDAFEAADENGNGRLDPAEWNKHWKKLKCSAFHGWMAFKEADVSEDGYITPDEYYKAVGEYGDPSKFAPSPKEGSKEALQDEETYAPVNEPLSKKE